MVLKFKYFFVLIFLGGFNFVHGEDYYSSVTGLEKLIRVEKFLVENLENYIKAERLKSQIVRNFINHAEKEIAVVKNNSQEYLGNPLSALRAIKRLSKEWSDYYQMIFNNQMEGEYNNRVKSYEASSHFEKPVMEDLYGAANGVARLQNTYNLETRHLANGTILGKKVCQDMIAADCFTLGWSLAIQKDLKNSATWLLEARARLTREAEIHKIHGWGSMTLLKDDQILEYLIPVLLQNGITKMAHWILQEKLEETPNDSKVLKMVEQVEQRIQYERWALTKVNDRKNTEIKKHDVIRDLYEKTCRGELKQSPQEQRKLRCRYVHKNVPFCFIAPFKMEEFSHDPFVAVYHEAVYESEIQKIFNATTEKITRSGVGNGQKRISDVRTSKNTWLWYEMHPFLRPLAWRLTDITGLSLKSAEALQVVNYGIGGHYGPHYDFSEDEFGEYGGRGNRILTALIYINDVEFGGATAFPFLKLAVPPIKRSLVVWYNLHRSLEVDFRMKHAGCPVIKGSKWVCNEWFHSSGQEFNRPCGLQPDGKKSIAYKS